MQRQGVKRLKALVVGLGIGQLYKKVLTEAGISVVTVDLDVKQNADFLSVEHCFEHQRGFDIAVICTPNYTHYELAMKIAPETAILFVDKPGVANESQWRYLVLANPNTRIMMVKNNMWRIDAVNFKLHAEMAQSTGIYWINRNRVPKPGSWFTDRSCAFGGVSKDLVPHLLSIYACMSPDRYWENIPWDVRWSRRWSLEELQNSDYGEVLANGVYNVDDVVEFKMNLVDEDTGRNRLFHFIADWRNNEEEDIAVHYENNQIKIDTELGLCPEDAYLRMITCAIEKFDDVDFWKNQFEIDSWIHRTTDYIIQPKFEVKYAK